MEYRMKKRMSVIALLLAVLLLLTACGGKEINIDGTWDVVDAKSEDNAEAIAASMAQIKELGGTLTLTFQDGKMTLNMEVLGQSQTNETTYEIKDGKLVTEGSELGIRLDGDTLTLTEGNDSMTLKKQK